LSRAATALLLTLPGIPCIYTGDEAGQWFRPYFDAAPISFRERYRGLQEYHKKLIALRKEIPSLHSRQWQILEVEPGDQVFGYLRFSEDNRHPVLVLLNFGKEPAEIQVSLPEAYTGMIVGSALQDRLNDENIPFNHGKVIVPGFGARILTGA
jgi:glycosidase